MPNIGRSELPLRETPDGNGPAAGGELLQEGSPGADLAAAGSPVGLRPAGMVWVRGHEIPAEDGVLEPELGEDAVDDRRAHLGGPRTGQLTLGGERNAADPRSTVAGRL